MDNKSKGLTSKLETIDDKYIGDWMTSNGTNTNSKDLPWLKTYQGKYAYINVNPTSFNIYISVSRWKKAIKKINLLSGANKKSSMNIKFAKITRKSNSLIPDKKRIIQW